MQLERLACVVVSLAMSTLSPAQQTMEHNMPGHAMEMSAGHEHHGSAVSVSYDDLTKTASQLVAARRATAKYQDVRIAEADGYRAFGPDVPGMGIHYVGPHTSGFDVEHPDILLYEKNEAVPGSFSLVGVSYLLRAETDADGQPKNPPFPKTLASWHRHSELCVFPDRSVKANLTETDCVARGGTLQRPDAVDGPRLDLEGQSDWSLQSDKSQRTLGRQSHRGVRISSENLKLAATRPGAGC